MTIYVVVLVSPRHTSINEVKSVAETIRQKSLGNHEEWEAKAVPLNGSGRWGIELSTPTPQERQMLLAAAVGHLPPNTRWAEEYFVG